MPYVECQPGLADLPRTQQRNRWRGIKGLDEASAKVSLYYPSIYES